MPFLVFLLLHRDIHRPSQKTTIFLIPFGLDPRTDQPFSCGAPTATVHQEIASGAQDSQQDPRGDQCNQGLAGIALVAPNILFSEVLNPQLEEKTEKREPSHLQNVGSRKELSLHLTPVCGATVNKHKKMLTLRIF